MFGNVQRSQSQSNQSGYHPPVGELKMEIQEAISIVRSLADGMNPETRESCANDSVYRIPKVVTALNRALGALVSQEERDRNKPTSAGKYWTHSEDEQVCEELRKGTDFQQIAKTHNRTVGSIVARLIKLGKVTAGPSGPLFPPDASAKKTPLPSPTAAPPSQAGSQNG
jgi:hypothetical protein